MRHLDLSYEGKRQAEYGQIDNGKLPHGGYRGSKRHPPSHLSHDKGREFQQRLEEELSRVMEYEDMARHGGSPAWSILVHNSPSYTDESPLITNNFLAASKMEQINGTTLFNRTSLLPNKRPKLPRSGGLAYYRPNRMHQYLSATELKDSASEDSSLKYGRPTRTTLLRARQRVNSAPSNQPEKKKDFAHRLDEIKTAPEAHAPNTEYLQLHSVRDGESLHSYLTGARYNRAHCLDSKSVEHNGVYMPRNNPALGSFFTGPKGLEYIQEYESPRQDFPTPPSPPSPKRRPRTAPSYGRSRSMYSPVRPAIKPDQPPNSKYKYLKLNIVGSRLPLVATRDLQQSFVRLPKLDETTDLSDKRYEEALDHTYMVNRPLPSPVGYSEGTPFSKRTMKYHFVNRIEDESVPTHRLAEERNKELDGFGSIRIEGVGTGRAKDINREDGYEEDKKDEGKIDDKEEDGDAQEEERPVVVFGTDAGPEDEPQEDHAQETATTDQKDDAVEKEEAVTEDNTAVSKTEDTQIVSEMSETVPKGIEESLEEVNTEQVTSKDEQDLEVPKQDKDEEQADNNTEPVDDEPEQEQDTTKEEEEEESATKEPPQEIGEKYEDAAEDTDRVDDDTSSREAPFFITENEAVAVPQESLPKTDDHISEEKAAIPQEEHGGDQGD